MNIKLHQSTAWFIFFVLTLAFCYWIGRNIHIDVDAYRQLLGGFPIVVAGLIFIFLYVGITFFVWFGTFDLFRISASILFGAYWGTLFVWVAELLNAVVLFQLSRKFGQGYVLAKFRIKEKDLAQTKDKGSFLNIFILRVNPLIPFRLMDLGYGLSQVSLQKYLAAISVSSLIRIFWLQLILEGIGVNLFKDPKAITDYLHSHPRVMLFSGIYFLLVLVISIVAVVIKTLKGSRKLNSGN